MSKSKRPAYRSVVSVIMNGISLARRNGNAAELALWETRHADFRAMTAKLDAAFDQVRNEYAERFRQGNWNHAESLRAAMTPEKRARISATMKRKGITPQRNMLNKGV